MKNPYASLMPQLRPLGWLLLLATCLFPLERLSAQVSQTFNTSGTFTPPTGVTQVVVECWGGGGRGGTRTTNGRGGGGGGGAYSRSLVTVTPNVAHTVTVGAGSNSTAAGEDSWFLTATTVMAKGGNSVATNAATGATGGAAASGIGTVRFSGGNGADGGTALFGSYQFGGGGGSSAGYAAAGAAGSSETGGTAPAGGGDGGDGNAGFGGQGAGTAGTAPGGGGGGARRTSGTQSGGNGANGRVVITYFNNGDCISGTTGYNNIPDLGCAGGTVANIPLLISGQAALLGTNAGNARLTSVELRIAHSYRGDLQVRLISPAGTSRDMIIQKPSTGAGGDNLGNLSLTCPSGALVLQDGATALTSMNSGTNNGAVGTFAPEQTLAGFTGNPNGTWILRVCDNAASDVGSIGYVRLNFCTVPQITASSSNSPLCAGETLTLNTTVTGVPTPTLSWTGAGTYSPNNSSANVSVTGAATGNYTLTATSSCGSTNVVLPVTVNPLPTVTCPANSSTCTNTAPYALSGASPGGGTYTGTGVSAGTFNPATAGVGTHTITYTYTDGNSCTNACNFQITVNAPTAVTCPADAAMCIDVAPFALSGASPTGGTYTGPGVSAGTFDPAAAGPGAHTITYSYTNGNNCTSTCTFTLTVNALPVMSCPADATVCIDEAAFTLSGASPNGGTYSGTGVSGGEFEPAAAGLGTHTITYSYTDGNSCSNSCSFTLTVADLPVVTCPGDITDICSSDAPFVLTGASPGGGTYTGTGVSGGQFDAGVAGAGTHTITYSYTDGNSCTSTCTFTIAVTQATTWYADQDSDGFGDAGTTTQACEQPVGYVADNSDTCPLLFGQNGDFCDANPGPGYTLGQITACACVPVTCTTNLNLIFNPDGATNIQWELRQQGSNVLVQSGGGVYPPAPEYSESTCLPNGSFYLVVTSDLGGIVQNGFQGGYRLRTSGGTMLVDNRNNFLSGTTSQVAGGEGFDLPASSDRLIYTSCDKLDWRNNEYVVANDNPTVTAQYGVDNVNNGYQMWWYNPNGGYSFRRFQNHNTSNGLPASSTRACHFRVNGWSGNQLQNGVLYNVKVRTMQGGVYQAWGPACRFKLDPNRADCPLTNLMDIPGNSSLSCGGSRAIGSSQAHLVHARPVKKMVNNAWVNANKYQFRFRIPDEFIDITKTSGTGQYWVNTTGLAPCKTYQVEVRASFDNGATWCDAYPAANPYAPLWGRTCLLNTTGCANGGNENMAMDNAPAAQLLLFPNPNNGQQVQVSLSQVAPDVDRVSIDITDAFGKLVATRTLAVNEHMVNTVVELNGELAGGLYVVNVRAGVHTYTQRLVVQP